MATVTSAAEESFLFSMVSNTGVWLSGSDREIEGTWKWLAGPEAGETFWSNGVTLTYANWTGGEPNNANNAEDWLWAHWSGARWNDVFVASQIHYVIEYGGMSAGVPEPATWAMMILGFGLAGSAARAARRRRLA